MNRKQIESLIPHRPPMLLVDEVIEKTDDHVVCRKTFHSDEFFFRGHYPDNPIVPGIILCEAAMQAGAILVSQSGYKGTPVATRMNDVRFRKIIRPGDTVDLHVQLTERLSNAFFMRAKITFEGAVATRFEFGCALSKDG